jgi:hypothetical protein
MRPRLNTTDDSGVDTGAPQDHASTSHSHQVPGHNTALQLSPDIEKDFDFSVEADATFCYFRQQILRAL